MNIYGELLVLHGYLREPLGRDDFGPTYGNRIASAEGLRERWQHSLTLAPDRAANEPTLADSAATVRGCG